jgi:hypothetical protein
MVLNMKFIYIFFFLNYKIKIKRLWLRLWGPSEIHMPLLGSPGPGPMYRLIPLHFRCLLYVIQLSDKIYNSGHMRRGISRYIGPGPGEPRRGM